MYPHSFPSVVVSLPVSFTSLHFHQFPFLLHAWFQLVDTDAATYFRSEIDNALESVSRLVDNMAHMAKHH